MNENKKNWFHWDYPSTPNRKINQQIIISANRKILIFSITFLIIFCCLISIKFIEIVSLADGKAIPQGRIKYVQHLEGGIVDQILVKEGDKVNKLQPLIILSKEKASSEFEEINTRLNTIDISILRLVSSKKGLEKINFGENINRFTEEQQNLENALLKSTIKKFQSEKETIKKNVINLAKRLELIKEQIKISDELLKVEATNRFKHLELLRQLSSVEGQIDEQKNKVLSIESNFTDEINNQLSELNKEKEELNKRITKFSDNLNRTVLKSPVAGIIKMISVNSKGSIVAPGVTVVEIVPDNEKLIIEAKLPPSEIGYVFKGLDAKIRLNSPDGSRFKPIDGRVTYVGADRINEKDENSYFLVKIETDENFFLKNNEKYKLFSGVPVIVGIITGKRNFFDYFISPIKSKISFALSER